MFLKRTIALAVPCVALAAPAHAAPKPDYRVTIDCIEVTETTNGAGDPATLRVSYTVSNFGIIIAPSVSTAVITASGTSGGAWGSASSLVPRLAPGGSQSYTKNVTVPGSSIACYNGPNGPICLVDVAATADAYGDIDEVFEANNTDTGHVNAYNLVSCN